MKFQQAFADAQSVAVGNDNPYIEPQHLLYALLNQDESERTLGLARLLGAVERIVAESGAPAGFDAPAWAAQWLQDPVPALGGRAPAEFLSTADGRAMAASLILQMQSGAYA